MRRMSGMTLLGFWAERHNDDVGSGVDVLTPRVRELNAQIAQAQQALGERRVEFDRLRELLAQNSQAANDPESPEFKAAFQASQAVDEVAGRLENLRTARDRLLQMSTSSGGYGGGNGPQDGDTATSRALARVGEDDSGRAALRAPGVLLSAILEGRKADVPTLPQDVRYKPSALGDFGLTPMAAQTTPYTTTQISTRTETDAFIDLLAPLSVALASGIPTLRIDGTEVKLPRFLDLPVADFIPELGLFPKNGPGVEMVTVKPQKCGLISELSLEVFEDLRPLVLAGLQLQILRAVALEFDHGILFGSGTGAEPRGIANTPGIMAVTGVPLTSLAAFAQALARLIGKNARPGALVMNPLDVGTLLQLTEETGSSVPLWKASVNSASGLRLPYFDTPIWPTPAAPQGSALLYDPETVLAVIRREADMQIDPYYGFDNGVVGLRSYLRATSMVAQVDGAVLITFAAS
jgi:HK97 family phage major capsid protein